MDIHTQRQSLSAHIPTSRAAHPVSPEKEAATWRFEHLEGHRFAMARAVYLTLFFLNAVVAALLRDFGTSTPSHCLQ